MTTNLEKWRMFLKDISSPDSFINMSFYFMIGAALQRRVWLGSPHLHTIFPNDYTILVGEPGIGKGLVLKPCKEMLRFHKRIQLSEQASSLQRDEDSIIKYIEATLSGNSRSEDKENKEKYIFPDGADSTTYQAMVLRHNKSVTVTDTKQKMEMSPNGIYTHSSMYVLLEEISSLFKRNNEDITKYLLNAYDCSDYEYETKHNGTNDLKKPCLSMLGGTTPGFMQDCFDSKLMDDGFSSRCIFVYESSNRFNKFEINDPDPTQIQAKKDILLHIKKLSSLFGQATYTPEAKEYFRHYFEEELPHKRVNANEKLIPYYARKNVHAQKLAMAIHFADSLDMVIGIGECIQALKILEALEKRMHLALQFKGNNPLAGSSKRLLKFLKNSNSPQTFVQMWQEVGDDVDEDGLRQILRYLLQTEKIVELMNQSDINGRTVIKYDLKFKEEIVAGESKIKEVLKEAVAVVETPKTETEQPITT